MRKETENTETIVRFDDDDPFAGELFSVIARFAVRSRYKASAVKPDQNWELFGLRFGRSPDNQVEAVFARLIVAEVDVAENIGLQAGRTEFVSEPDARPFWR